MSFLTKATLPFKSNFQFAQLDDVIRKLFAESALYDLNK
uniref:Uncharacterized protein n=1 Tax=viral metagenome TaxID=1070528 RepID=A0A6C0CAP1_9ZZZZ